MSLWQGLFPDSLEATVYSQSFPIWEPRTWGQTRRPHARECSWYSSWLGEIWKVGGCFAIAGSRILYLYKEVRSGGLWGGMKPGKLKLLTPGRRWRHFPHTDLSTHHVSNKMLSILEGWFDHPHNSPVGGSAFVPLFHRWAIWDSESAIHFTQGPTGSGIGIQTQATRLRNLPLSHQLYISWS